MKRYVRHAGMLLVFAVTLTGLALGQQFAYRVAATMPSDFYVGEQRFAAGSYIFAVNYGDHEVTIENQNSRHSSVVKATPFDYPATGAVTMGKPTEVQLISTGGRYQLADIRTSEVGVTFPQANASLEAARNGGMVTVIASLR
jgi:hypothetical protein